MLVRWIIGHGEQSAPQSSHCGNGKKQTVNVWQEKMQEHSQLCQFLSKVPGSLTLWLRNSERPISPQDVFTQNYDSTHILLLLCLPSLGASMSDYR